jgi:hypothetical protein
LNPLNAENPRRTLDAYEITGNAPPINDPAPILEGASCVMVFAIFGTCGGNHALMKWMVVKYTKIAITKYEMRMQKVLFIFSHTA